ncbi:MAG: metallophosphoesterase [Bacillota bacterium]
MRLGFGRNETLVYILFSLVGMFALVSLGSASSYYIDAFQVGLSLRIFDRGQTEVVIPPVGRIRAITHRTPLELIITLENVDPNLLAEAVAEAGDREALVQKVSRGLRRIVSWFMLRVLLLSAIGGGMGVRLLGVTKRRSLIFGVLVASFAMGSLLLLSWVTYDIKGFSNPQYFGMLEAAPWMTGLLEESVVRIDQLGGKLAMLAENLSMLFGAIDRLEPLGRVRADTRILLVSDIHNNPAAMDFIQRAVEVFDISFIIDAGDLTDWGTAIEASITRRIEDFGVPYLIAPGNHEAPDIIRHLRNVRNVIVLDGQLERVSGISVLGVADDGADTSLATVSDAGIARQRAAAKKALAESAVPPMILVIHNIVLGREFIGMVPVVVSGHSHSFGIERGERGILINPGTTGAAGLRGITVPREVPYSMAILHIREWRPIAVDTIHVYNVKSTFTLQRTLVEDIFDTPGW